MEDGGLDFMFFGMEKYNPHSALRTIELNDIKYKSLYIVIKISFLVQVPH
jgi:hypothetical protein